MSNRILAAGLGYHLLMRVRRSAHPLRQALLAQLAGSGLVGGMAYAWPGLVVALWHAVLLQAVLAALIGQQLGAPRWWIPLHLGFLPAVLLASQLKIAAGWYLAGFVLLLLVYWRIDRSQVPLYLSNAETAAAVADLLPASPCRVVDLGCGHGALLRHLARVRPDCQFVGVEHAPLPWLWAWLAARGQDNLQIRHGDFWQVSLASFDVVYAFLSPVPMARLYALLKAQLSPGSLLVSNSFVVPGVAADAQIKVADQRETQLHCYRMPPARQEIKA